MRDVSLGVVQDRCPDGEIAVRIARWMDIP